MVRKESVETSNKEHNRITGHELVLDSYEGAGPRGAWFAAAYCVSQGLPCPDWALRYLVESAPKVLDYEREHPIPVKLSNALGLRDENERRVDPKRDPDLVYDTIQEWYWNGRVPNVSKGAEKYLDEVLRDSTDIQTVRGWYHSAQRRRKSGDVGAPPPITVALPRS